MSFVFFQAEDGIRDLVRSRGLGDVYKRQVDPEPDQGHSGASAHPHGGVEGGGCFVGDEAHGLSLIHI